MELNFKEIGRNIRIARARKGINQSALAETIDMTAQHISHIETAKTRPSLTALVAIANVLNTDIDSLLGDNIKSQRKPILEGELAEIAHLATKGQLKLCVKICRDIVEEDSLVDKH